MSATTPSRDELRAYRQHLQSLAARLSGDVAQLTAEATRPTAAEGARGEVDTKESTITSSEGDEEVARGILVSEGRLLTEVREALIRLDAGTFGCCERCGRPIGKPRLKAVPYARRCIRCAGVENGDPD
jgi:RNA polymerase-binding transcription factor DksA